MLTLRLIEGEYVFIGNNVKVVFDEMNHRGGIVLGIEAPKDAQILRGKHYEAELDRMAAEGSTAAKELRNKLEREWLKLLRKSGKGKKIKGA